MLTPEARAQMEQAKQRHRGARWLAGESVDLVDGRFGARTIGILAEITPGLEVWTNADDDMARHNHDGHALGGYVLHVDAGWTQVDPETGEITNHPASFRCYDPQGAWPHRAFPTLTETEIHRPSVAIPPAHKLVIAVRRFCREVGTHNSLTLDAFDAGLVTDAARLVAVLMGSH